MGSVGNWYAKTTRFYRTVVKVREKKRKNTVKILTCALSAFGAIGLLLFHGSLPLKDSIQIGHLPKEFSIEVSNNYIDFQVENECSAYASAYVMRHLGRQVAGSELYDDIDRVLGFVSVNSVVSLFQSYGYTAKAYHGDNSTLKQRLISGVPVIAFIRTPDDTHYVVVVGYDENFIYLVDSISDNANANGGWYNRKLSTEEFDAIWKTNMYPVENIYIVISGS